MHPSPHHRRCLPLHGTPEATATRAHALLAQVAADEVLWISVAASPAHPSVRPDLLRKHLGGSATAVVLDLHEGLDADLLAMAHGFVRGGGALLLRMPPCEVVPTGADDRLVVWPFTPGQVGHRLWQRLLRLLPPDDERPLLPIPQTQAATEEQDRHVQTLLTAWHRPGPSAHVLLARRGRGKSATLGRALAALDPSDGVSIVTAADPRAAAEVFRFATGAPKPPSTQGALRFEHPEALLDAPGSPRVMVVDEAAQLSVPLLTALALRHPTSHLVLATTVEGYEGSGRGFRGRFLPWLAAREVTLVTLEPQVPLRWAPDDPLERLIDDVLAAPRPTPRAPTEATPEHHLLTQDRLADDDGLLRQVIGLLTEAHYRTTPGDLHRLLDAPNLRLHALLAADQVVAVNLVAREGSLPAGTHARLRGHVLAENLATHLGLPELGRLSMLRSVRIAVDPAWRRRGLARQLTEAVHAHHHPDLFGTVFGATPAVLRFRRSLGYELVRLGNARGVRSGEPSAVMVRPVAATAAHLVEGLRADLARDLPLQLDLIDADGPPSLSEALRAALLEDLPAPGPRTPDAAAALIDAWLAGERTYEAAATELEAWVCRLEDLGGLPPVDRALIEDRVLRRLGWRAVCRRAGLPSVPATMRAVRAALARLRALHGPPAARVD